MALDPNSVCPAGKGKKVKFCCSALANDLQKIGRMLEGEQYLACIQHIDQMEARGDFRPCTMTVKSELRRTTQQIDSLPAYARMFSEKFPDCPAAWAELALMTTTSAGALAALDHLQTALDCVTSDLPANILSAIAVIADLATYDGLWLPALGLLQLLSGLSPDDPYASRKLMSITRSGNIPLLVRSAIDTRLDAGDVPWQSEFDAAIDAFERGCWRKAAGMVEALIGKLGDAPVLWRSLAHFRAFLGQNAAAIVALRKYASLDVPLDDAVEAEALAMLLDPATLGDPVDVLAMTWTVDDPDRLIELATSDRRFTMTPPPKATEDGSPPPRMVMIVCDRNMPTTAVGLAAKDLPHTLAQVKLFGRQTDRPAQLEFGLVYGNSRDELVRIFREVVGPTLQGEPQEAKVAVTSLSRQMIHRRWAVPPDMQRDQLQNLGEEYLRETLLHAWIDLPLGILDGRSTRQASPIPAARCKLLAVMMIVEEWVDQVGKFDMQELRQALSLPAPAPITLAEHEIETVPAARVHRVQADRLSDEDLLIALERVEWFNAPAAVQCVATAATRRASFAGRPERAEAFALLAHCADNMEDGLAALAEGRQAAVEANISCVKWDFWELPLRLARRESKEVIELMQHIEAAHIREPGVAEALTNFMVEIGMINPDGTPRMPMEARPAPPEVTGKLWTPDSDPATSKGGKLWTPGS